MSSFSWCGGNSSRTTTSSYQRGTTTTKVVHTTIRNGETTVTTTYTEDPHSIGLWEPQNFEQINLTVPTKKVPCITPAARVGPKTPAKSLNQFEQECLDEHNRLRAIHGCAPLQLNRNLCKYSTEWAKKLASKNMLQHRSQQQYGENLYMSSGYAVDGIRAVKSWYDEISQYNYSRPGFSSRTGHFTQVVWKDSRELGIGVETRGNSTWVVANYDPPGNVSTQYEQNVPRPRR